MLIAKISVTGVRAASTKLGTLTSGMVGAEVQFTFDSGWDGLNKTAVFRCMDITKDVLNIDSEVTIPHEVLVRSGSPLYVGVYGTNAAGDLVIPTRWATVGIVYSGADPSGDPSTERSPNVWEQLQSQINELKNQGADADAIKQAVDAYMAANPPAESDPTVPEWAKQPQKPKYTASEVGALASDELQNAVNVALTHAKESGAFDGPQGPAGPQGEAGPAGADGKDGQPGEDGKDYVLTEADKTEIAEQAAGLVEVPKPGGIEVTGASVGQIIVVKAVDENGKPTAWETADLPQGGGGSAYTDTTIVDVETTEEVSAISVPCTSEMRQALLNADQIIMGYNIPAATSTGETNGNLKMGFYHQYSVHLNVVAMGNSAASNLVPSTQYGRTGKLQATLFRTSNIDFTDGTVQFVIIGDVYDVANASTKTIEGFRRSSVTLIRGAEKFIAETSTAFGIGSKFKVIARRFNA